MLVGLRCEAFTDSHHSLAPDPTRPARTRQHPMSSSKEDQGQQPFEDVDVWQDPLAEPPENAPAQASAAAASEPAQDEPKPTLDGEDPAASGEGIPAELGIWESARHELRARYPEARDGVLFCVFKLSENSDVSLRDFRDEAKLRGVPVSGRSLHSAKVLLGMAAPATRRTKEEMRSRQVDGDQPSGGGAEKVAARQPHQGPEPMPRPQRSQPTRSTARPEGRTRHPSQATGEQTNLEGKLAQALQDIQDSANAEADRLRGAISQAIEILQAAVDED